MKTLILSLLLMMVIHQSYSQLPTPTNLKYTCTYIPMDEWNVCNDEAVWGPTYCSTLSWTYPDTSITHFIVDHFNVYNCPDEDFDNVCDNEATVVKTTKDTLIHGEFALTGLIWVTAIYVNPESKPSNIIENIDLPIGLIGVELPEGMTISYDQQNQKIHITGQQEIESIKIFDLKGALIKEIKNSNLMLVADLRPGTYIVVAEDSSCNTISQSIIK